LKNLIERILILFNPETITPAHLPQELHTPVQSSSDMFPLTLPVEGLSLSAYLASIEERLIRQALERTNNNITQAAKLLDIPRETLRYRLGRGSTAED
jgi:arginine utilization regulatory protein